MGGARPGRLLVALLLLAAGSAGCDSAPPPRPALRLDPAPSSAGPVLAVTDPAPAAGAGLPLARLDGLLLSGPLGASPGALVVDAASGQVLLDRQSAVARTPASVLKLATATAALSVLDPGARLRTSVVRGTDGRLVLVGGGDTTLTRRPDPRAHPRRAGLVALAEATAQRLARDGVTAASLSVDDTLYGAPAVSPDWRPTYVASGVVSPVSALSLDAGRVRPDGDARAADPALAAGEVFAALLRRRGLTVAPGVTRAPAPAGAVEVAAVASPTIAELVELMLGSSDNDLAESLLRQVAIARERPATFTGGADAVVEVLDGLAVPTAGLSVLDGSGLARGSTIAPATLAALLVLAAGPTSPQPLDHVLTGLPVAGFSGTLSTRYGAGRAGTAAGLVRAKTGTLTGVSTLAGVTSAGGRPVVFVVLADRVPGDTLAARAVLDRFAATLAGAPD